jgi:branched-chain amino acid transport system ATP-binding protein
VALRDVDLTVKAGEIVALIGANGAGKSTLMMTICGQPRPREGRVLFEGTDITGQPTHAIMRLGIAQSPEGRRVFPRMTVRENLQVGEAMCGRADTSAYDKVYELFPILKERAAQDAGLLSGGQQQMLAISRALMAQPELILLDEPSLGLSPKLTKEIFEIVVRINRERGTTILLVEQNANMALNAADYGYVLENGRIVMEDTCDRLREKEDIKEFYLGMKEEGVRGERRWKKKKTWR